MKRVRVVLPEHLRHLAGTARDVSVEVRGEVTQRSVLDALEASHPGLRSTIRDRETGRRRPLVRFFGCEEDLSHEPPDAPLPAKVAEGSGAFYVVGAITGG